MDPVSKRAELQKNPALEKPHPLPHSVTQAQQPAQEIADKT
jgi:hypothetical protein